MCSSFGLKIVEEIESHLFVTEEIEEAININLKRAERFRHSILRQAFAGDLGLMEALE